MTTPSKTPRTDMKRDENFRIAEELKANLITLQRVTKELASVTECAYMTLQMPSPPITTYQKKLKGE